MKLIRYLFFGVLLLICSLQLKADPLLTIWNGAAVDTIDNSNAADTSRQFLNSNSYSVVYLTVYQSSKANWKTYLISYPCNFVSRFKINYAGNTDSSATISGLMNGIWVNLPFHDYSTSLTRTIILSGGGTAMIRFDGYSG